MNALEQECIVLNLAWKMIDDMVNWAMFVKNEDIAPTNMLFETSQHRRLFIILLGDFLSQLRAFKGQPIPLGLAAAASNAQPSDLTFLNYLRQVCRSPDFAPTARALSHRIEVFASWLEKDFLAENVNLHEIGIVASIRVTRIRYIKICSDIAKHNLARLSTNVGHIKSLLESSGHHITEQQAYLAVDNFFDWFHDDIFIYHSSQIAEFLNNIRWAIFEYLQPEFERSWHLTPNATESLPHYSYSYPKGCTDPLARAMYWELMNRIRSRPLMYRFVISDALKQRY